MDNKTQRRVKANERIFGEEAFTLLDKSRHRLSYRLHTTDKNHDKLRESIELLDKIIGWTE